MHDRQDDGRADGAERAVGDEVGESVLAAWRSLPDAFRALLWGMVVHHERPPRPDLVHAVTDRGDRARDRLRLGLRSELVARASTPECAAARRRLGGNLRGPQSGSGRARGEAQGEAQGGGTVETDVDAGVRAHVEACERCRVAAAVLDDLDGAIRTRVAPALLPGAFAVEAERSSSSGPAVVPAVPAPSSPAEVAGARPRAEAMGARVLTVPRRSVSLVAASASLVLAVVLLILGSGPRGSGGSVMGDAPGPSGPSVANGVAGAVVVPDGRTSLAEVRSLIGMAVAESLQGADGAVRKAARASTAHPPSTAPLSADPPGAPPPAAAAPAFLASRSPRPPSPQTRGAAVRTLAFDPAERGTFVARLAVSPGWLVASVVDGRGRRVVEHVAGPTTHLEERLRAGRVVVTVRRVTTDARVGPGALSVSFVGPFGSALPGSGTYALR